MAALSPAAQRLLSTALTRTYELVSVGSRTGVLAALKGTAVAVVHRDFGTPDLLDVIDAQSGAVLEFRQGASARGPASRTAVTIKHRRDADGEHYLTGGCMRRR